MISSSLTVGSYAIASGLVGFQDRNGQPIAELRVRVQRVLDFPGGDGFVNVRTADLLDAGTALTLRADQLAPMVGWDMETVVSHKTGVAGLAG